jgi:hypothetical protein
VWLTRRLKNEKDVANGRARGGGGRGGRWGCGFFVFLYEFGAAFDSRHTLILAGMGVFTGVRYYY